MDIYRYNGIFIPGSICMPTGGDGRGMGKGRNDGQASTYWELLYVVMFNYCSSRRSLCLVSDPSGYRGI